MRRLTRNTDQVQTAAMAAMAMLLAGSSVSVARLLAGYPVLSGQALRYALAAVLLLPFVPRRALLLRPSLREIVLFLALGATGLAAFNVCVVLAVREADPSAVGVIVGCVPVALALVEPLLHTRWPAGRLLTAATVVTIGAVLVQGIHGSTSPGGLALSFGALASEAGFSLLAAPLIPRFGPACVSLYACVAAVVMLGAGAVAAVGRDAFPVPTFTEVAAIAYLGVATPVAFVSWYTGIERMGVARTGVIAALVPVGAFVTALVVGASTLQPLRAAGTLLVGLGLALALAPDRRSRRTFGTT